jgi:ribose-phosphate pyrophosphokinase
VTQIPSVNRALFLTPEHFAREQPRIIESARGRLLVASCRSGSYLAAKVVQRYHDLLAEAGGGAHVLYLEDVDDRFSDGETCIRLDIDVSGYDIFLIQSLYDTTTDSNVDQDYMALLIAARTFREWGANHVTAVLPYLAYARQDKPTKFKREPTTAKLMADLSLEAGFDRIITWHPHSDSISGFYEKAPVVALEPLRLFVEEYRRFQDRDDVIAVAPDAGASKLVTYFGRTLNLNSAIGSKYRPRPEEAMVAEVIGDFEGKRVALVLDDMVSSGGTVYALIKMLVEEKGIEEVYLGASHNLCMAPARERLVELHRDYHLKEVVVTNSVPQTAAFQSLSFVSVRGLSDTLTRVINRIHYNRPVSEVFTQAPVLRKLE